MSSIHYCSEANKGVLELLWQVGSSVFVPGADHALRSIHNIREALPEIWEGQEGEQLEQVIQSTAVEAVVLA